MRSILVSCSKYLFVIFLQPSFLVEGGEIIDSSKNFSFVTTGGIPVFNQRIREKKCLSVLLEKLIQKEDYECLNSFLQNALYDSNDPLVDHRNYSLIQQAILQELSYIQFLFVQGNILQQEDRHFEAIEPYSEGIRLLDSVRGIPHVVNLQRYEDLTSRLCLQLGECYLALKQPFRALEVCNGYFRGSSEQKGNEKTRFLIVFLKARSLFHLGYCSQALKILDSVEESGESQWKWQALLLSSEISLSLGNLKDSEKKLWKLILFSPSRWMVETKEILLGQITLFKGEEILGLRILKQLQKKTKSREIFQEISHILGNYYFSKKEYANALDYCISLENLLPSNENKLFTARLAFGSTLESGSSFSVNERYFTIGKKRYEVLIQKDNDGSLRLEYANSLLEIGKRKNLEGLFYKKIDEILTSYWENFTKENQAKGLSLLITIISAPEKKRECCRVLCGRRFLGCSERAFGYLELGKSFLHDDQARAEECFSQAISLFDKEGKGKEANEAVFLQASCYPPLMAIYSLINRWVERKKNRTLSDDWFLEDGLYNYSLQVLESLEKENFISSVLPDMIVAIFADPLTMDRQVKQHRLVALLTYFRKQYSLAVEYFRRIADVWAEDEDLAGEALLFASRAAEAMNSKKEALELSRELINRFPKTIYACEAYFRQYQFQEYLQGEKEAIKHLNKMEKRFPPNRFQIVAFYLLGLDMMRDRKTDIGKSLRRKDLLLAGQHFSRGKDLYNTLEKKGKIPLREKKYYREVFCRTCLEVGRSYQAVGEEASEAKKRIYREYAIKEFYDLQQLLLSSKKEPLSILQECDYFLADSLVKNEDYQKAKKTIEKACIRYKEIREEKGNFVAKIWKLFGEIEIKERSYAVALDALKKAERADFFHSFTKDESLEIKILMSQCLMNTGEKKLAMRMLSDVINEQVVSSQRVRAMYLRAELYFQEGKMKQALKQLEFTAKQNGEWALAAQNRLDFFCRGGEES